MNPAELLAPPIWTPWTMGPVRELEGPALVSFTEFTPHTYRRFPHIGSTGLRLAQGWYGMEGAVGLFLYFQLSKKRCGSVSVWRNQDDLGRFIRLPWHVEIMQHYRPLGTIRAKRWEQDRFDRAEVKRSALRWLAGASS